MCDLIFSGVFERHLRLTLAIVEFELAWAPHVLSTMDYTYRERHGEAIYRFKDGMLPSDFFRRNVVLSFQEDAIGIRLRDVIGVDNMMWGSDRSRAVWEPPMLKRKRRASFSSDQLVPIVGDAAIATKSIGEGRIVPLIIFDENARPDLAELVRVHQELEPGDADCQWGS